MLVKVGILRISTKYAVSHLRQHVLRVVEKLFPTSKEHFLVILVNVHSLDSKISVSDTFLMANVARELGATALLVTALFLCCLHSLDDVLDGIPSSSGHIELNEANKRAIIRSRSNLICRALTDTERVVFFGTPCGNAGCTTEKQCLANSVLQVFKSVGFCSPILVFDTRYGTDLHTTPVCDACIAEMRRCCEEGTQKAWDALPEIFGFTNWGDLLRDQEDEDK